MWESEVSNFDFCKKLVPKLQLRRLLLTLVRSERDIVIVQKFVEQCAEISKFGMMMMLVVRHRKFVFNLVVS